MFEVGFGIGLGLCGCAAFSDGFQGDAGVDAEAWLGGAVDVEQAGDGRGEGVAVEDLGMAEDVHEESVGADGGVEFAPGPVVAGGGAAGGGVGLGEAAEPGGFGGDGEVGCGVEVAVRAELAAAEDDEGVGVLMGAGGDFVNEFSFVGEFVGAGVEVAAEEGCGPCDWVGWGVWWRHKGCGGVLSTLERLMPL